MSKVHSFAVSSLSDGASAVIEAADTIYTLDEASSSTHRVIRIYWKTTDKNPNPPKPVWVAVKTIRATDVNPVCFLSMLNDRIDDLQDSLIRRWLETHPGDSSRTIPETETNLDAILALFRAESAGKRLGKDSIKEYFDASVSDLLMKAISEKVADITPDALANAVQGYRNKMLQLASPVPALSESELQQLGKVLVLTPDSPMATTLADRITASLKKFEKQGRIDFL